MQRKDFEKRDAGRGLCEKRCEKRTLKKKKKKKKREREKKKKKRGGGGGGCREWTAVEKGFR